MITRSGFVIRARGRAEDNQGQSKRAVDGLLQRQLDGGLEERP